MRFRHHRFSRPIRLLVAAGVLLLAGRTSEAADCSSDAANILEHCGFQSSTDVTTQPNEWILGGDVAPCFSVGTFSHNAADGSNTPPRSWPP